MSALHQLIPFGDEMKTKQFLAYLGRDLPENVQYGRNPQLEELIGAFNNSGLATDYTLSKEGSNKSWSLVISNHVGERLRIDAKQRGQDKDNVLFTVTGDRDILEYLVAHLPASCGTFLVSTDGQNPAVVTAGG